jgi:predicted RNA binding protein YcfA (HicA-like mRNA interferase family)
MVSALEILGSKPVRQRGSHVVMRRGEQACVVPLHKEVKTGTPAGILRQAQVSVEELGQAVAD